MPPMSAPIMETTLLVLSLTGSEAESSSRTMSIGLTRVPVPALIWMICPPNAAARARYSRSGSMTIASSSRLRNMPAISLFDGEGFAAAGRAEHESVGVHVAAPVREDRVAAPGVRPVEQAVRLEHLLRGERDEDGRAVRGQGSASWAGGCCPAAARPSVPPSA